MERARFVRAHRKSVQRWLDDLQAAGVVAHEPERDTRGQWWRTQIVLLAAPDPTGEELRVARRRARGWRRRERARQRRLRVAPSLAGIRGRSGVPGPAVRGRVARARGRVVHETSRRAAVDEQIAAADERRAACRDLTHPFGAPPTSADFPVSPHGFGGPATLVNGAAACPAQTVTEDEAVVVETGARAGAADDRPALGAGALKGSIEEVASLSREDFDVLVARRVAEREHQMAWRTAALRAQVSERVAMVRAWPAGTTCPLGRLREAWVVHRYGLAEVVQAGAAAAGAPRPQLARRVGEAIELYEAHAEQRPPGWPESGAAALCVLASQRRADRLAGDVARLTGLAGGCARSPPSTTRRGSHTPAREPSAGTSRRRLRDGSCSGSRARSASAWRPRSSDASASATRSCSPATNPAAWPNAELAVRYHPAARSQEGIEPELVDRDPCEELDGVGARARRYRDELARGRWRLPHLDFDQHPGPKEAPDRMTHCLTIDPPGGLPSPPATRTPTAARRPAPAPAPAPCHPAVGPLAARSGAGARRSDCTPARLSNCAGALLATCARASQRSCATARLLIESSAHLRKCADAQLVPVVGGA